MIRCVSIVLRLVPYHDARFNAADRVCDLTVVDFSHGHHGPSWGIGQDRSFRHIRLHREASSCQEAETLFGTLDELDPEVIAVQGWANQIALRSIGWGLRRKRSIVLFSESNYYDHPRNYLKELPKRLLLKTCDSALVGGHDHSVYLESLNFPRKRIHYGYNVIDNKHFSTACAKREASESTPYFLVSSRLAREKDVATIIHAYDRYRRASSGDLWDLIIIGDGPLKPSLLELTEGLGLKENIHFRGFVPYGDLPDVFAQAGALLHASVSEPWGLVINEALAAGLPVVVSDRTGCSSELVRHDHNGFIFSAGDFRELTKYMQLIADGSVDRFAFGHNGREIVGRFSPERFASGFLEALASATSEPKRKKGLSAHVMKCLINASSLY